MGFQFRRIVEVVRGPDGVDRIVFSDGSQLIFGTGDGDNILGGDGNDIIFAGGGDDFVDAGDGNDWVLGGSGDDEIHGGAGHDHLLGGSGDDTIYGDEDCDLVVGGRGDDFLQGGAGSDLVLGGSGNDTAVYNLADNVGEWDLYHGGRDTDTLKIDLTGLSVAEVNARGFANHQAYADAIEAFFDAGGNRVNFNQMSGNAGFSLVAKKFEIIMFELPAGNLAPEAMDDEVLPAIGENDTVLIDVLANDSDPDSDPLEVVEVDGQAISTGGSVILSGSGATVTLLASGELEYDPGTIFDFLDPAEAASDTFSYRISDGQGGFDEADVTVNLLGEYEMPAGVVGTAFADLKNLDGTAGNDSFAGLDGDDCINLVSGSLGPVSADGGNDTIVFSGAILIDSDVDAGAGDDTIEMSGVTGLISGDLNAGDGNDTIQMLATSFISGANLNAGDGNDSILIDGGLIDSGGNLNGGDGNDTIELRSFGLGFGSNLNAGAGDDLILMTGGNFSNGSLNAGDGNDTVEISAGPGGLTIRGDDTLAQTGVDTVLVTEAYVNSVHTLDTVMDFQQGEDLIAFQTAAGNPNGIALTDFSYDMATGELSYDDGSGPVLVLDLDPLNSNSVAFDPLGGDLILL